MDDVDTILGLYDERGSERYDEAVSQIEHALQCAALAERAGAGDELVVAALLHDIGHLLAETGERATTDRHHESVAVRHLDPVFGPGVSRPVGLHVRAKRYLCAIEPEYHADLSPGSVRSLVLQGGPLTATQIESFERLGGWRHAVELRRWDDLAKVNGAPTRGLDDYRGLLAELAGR